MDIDSDCLEKVASFLSWRDALSLSEAWSGGEVAAREVMGKCCIEVGGEGESRRGFVDRMRRGEVASVVMRDEGGREETIKGVCLIGAEGVLLCVVEKEACDFFDGKSEVVLTVSSPQGLFFENRIEKKEGGTWEGRWDKQGRGDMVASSVWEGCFLRVSCKVMRRGDPFYTSAGILFFPPPIGREKKRPTCKRVFQRQIRW